MAKRWLARPTVSVLVYHCVSEAALPRRFCCAPKRFAQHLDWLRALRYPVLSMDAFLQLLRHKSSNASPGHGVLLTFDDGYRDFAEGAYPLLRDRGMPAAVFVVAGHLGGTSDWPSAAPAHSPLLSASQVRELADVGVTIGAHGWSHRRLTEIPPEEALRELSEARRYLETVANQPISTLAYPYGGDSPLLQATVRKAGYSAAFTTRFGSNDRYSNPFALQRTEISGDDGLLSFMLKARFGCSLSQLLWLSIKARRITSLGSSDSSGSVRSLEDARAEEAVN